MESMAKTESRINTILSIKSSRSRRHHRAKPHHTISIRRKSQYTQESEYNLPIYFPLAEEHPDWRVITTAKVNDMHFVTKYRSRSTGMELVIASICGPTVHSYINLATRAENNDGLANILRNLIVMGSEDYPYPGVLERLTGKCLASANESTLDIDRTCFQMTTAGAEGTLTLLPIYLDHIFFPLLSEPFFVTEIHHVNADGTDDGPLYKTVLSQVHDPDVKKQFHLNSNIYDPSSGYQYQYLGIPENITKTDIHKVRDYHKRYYQPMNTSITVCGQIDPVHIFECLQPMLDKLIAKGRVPSESDEYEDEWTKPWLAERLVEFHPHRPIKTSITFPSESEEFGSVVIGFLGPQTIYTTEQVVAMRLLLEYLTWGVRSPLQLAFVKNDSTLASSVTFCEQKHMKSLFSFHFNDVPVKVARSAIIHLFKQVLKAQARDFNKERMLTVINYCYQRDVSLLETEPHDVIAAAIANDFCYATSDDGLLFDRRVNNTYTIQQYNHQPISFWQRVINKGILEQPWVIIDCVPNTEEMKSIADEEEKRKVERLETLSEQELNALAHRYEKALKKKSVPTPVDIINSVKSPSLQYMGYHTIDHFLNPDWSYDFKCNLFLDDIASSFIYVNVIMDTTRLDVEQRKYMLLFIQAILRSPVYDDAQSLLLSHEELSSLLEKDVISHKLFLGFTPEQKDDPSDIFPCPDYSHFLCFRMQLEMGKAEEGFQWMRKILWNTKFDKATLKIIIDEIIAKINDIRNDGKAMVLAMLIDFTFKYNSCMKSSSPIRQQSFLKNLSEHYEKMSDGLIATLEAIRSVILHPDNMTVHIASTLSKLEFQLAKAPQEKLVIYKLLRRTFKNLYNEEEEEDDVIKKKVQPISDMLYMKDFDCIKKWAQELILRMKNKDPLSYLIQSSPCIKSYDSPELPKIMLATHYFAQKDGPFQKAMIDTGLAKELTLKTLPYNGMVIFSLTGCEDLVKAYNVAFDIILSHLNEGDIPPSEWDQSQLESARSSVIYKLISYENTPKTISLQSLQNHFRGVSLEYSRNLVDNLCKVTLDDIKLMAKKYLRELFVENVSCAVAAPSEKVPDIIKQFTNYAGKRFCLMSDIDFSFLSDW